MWWSMKCPNLWLTECEPRDVARTSFIENQNQNQKKIKISSFIDLGGLQDLGTWFFGGG